MAEPLDPTQVTVRQQQLRNQPLWIDQEENLGASMTVEQAAQLRDLKARLPLASQTGDRRLLRFLLAREWDVAAAENMLRTNEQWRKEQHADTVLTDWQPPENAVHYMPDGWQGTDIFGNPLMWEATGAIDPKGVMHAVRRADIIRYRGVYRGELAIQKMQEQSQIQGKRIDRCTTVLDLTGIGLQHLWKPWVTLSKELLRVFEANYPQTLRFCLVINAPRIFPMVYSMVKPFLPERTQSKIFVLRQVSELQYYIPIEHIPKMYGGTAPNPGQPGSTIPLPKGPVPPELYITSEKIADEGETVTVGRGSTHQHEIAVPVANSTIQYEFTTQDYDIGYGIYLRSLEAAGRVHKDDMQTVKENVRVDSNVIPEMGVVVVPQPGTYVLRFDNTYSWARTKTVTFCVQVLPPPD